MSAFPAVGNISEDQYSAVLRLRCIRRKKSGFFCSREHFGGSIFGAFRNPRCIRWIDNPCILRPDNEIRQIYRQEERAWFVPCSCILAGALCADSFSGCFFGRSFSVAFCGCALRRIAVYPQANGAETFCAEMCIRGSGLRFFQ